jgi:tetratricopeptide (TPR) repeat protein
MNQNAPDRATAEFRKAADTYTQAILLSATPRLNFFAHLALAAGHVQDIKTLRATALAIHHRWPASWSAHEALARSFTLAGLHDAALEESRRALELNPDDARSHGLLGWTLVVVQERSEEGIAALREAVRLDPTEPQYRYHLGTELAIRGAVDEAIEEYRQATQLGPCPASVHFNLGQALMSRGRILEAVAAFEEALRIDPQLSEVHNDLARAYEMSGRLEDALHHCRAAVDLNPGHARLRSHLANALCRHGLLDEAVLEAEKALRLDPCPATALDAHNTLCMALRDRGQVEEAIAHGREAVLIDPRSASAHGNLGSALKRQGLLEDASAAYRTALELHPDAGHEAQIRMGLGDVLIRQGLAGEGVAELRRAVDLDAECAEAWCNLGLSLQGEFQVAEALDALRRGHALGSKRASWAYPSRDWVRECEVLADSETRFRECVERGQAPEAPAELLTVAHTALRKSRPRLAAEWYQKAFDLEPELAQNPLLLNRFGAACAATVASAGRGGDAKDLDPAIRGTLRAQALAWLQDDLAALRRLAGNSREETRIARTLRRWLECADLAPVRDAEALSQLPVAELAAWQALWQEVRDLRSGLE